MSQRQPDRLPGDPPSGDRDYGPINGLADDAFFWVRDRERSKLADADRLTRQAKRGGAVTQSSGWLATRIRSLRARLMRERHAGGD